jgi:hypothetical protein
VSRGIARIIAILLLVVTGGLGIYNGVMERTNSYNVFQRSVYAAVVLYGVLGLIGAYGSIRGRSWRNRFVIMWGVAITFVSSTAALAYGGPEVSVAAAIASGLGGALIAVFVVWAVRAPERVVSQVTSDVP